MVILKSRVPHLCPRMRRSVNSFDTEGTALYIFDMRNVSKTHIGGTEA
jgi:hypothetical protein